MTCYQRWDLVLICFVIAIDSGNAISAPPNTAASTTADPNKTDTNPITPTTRPTTISSPSTSPTDDTTYSGEITTLTDSSSANKSTTATVQTTTAITPTTTTTTITTTTTTTTTPKPTTTAAETTTPMPESTPATATSTQKTESTTSATVTSTVHQTTDTSKPATDSTTKQPATTPKPTTSAQQSTQPPTTNPESSSASPTDSSMAPTIGGGSVTAVDTSTDAASGSTTVDVPTTTTTTATPTTTTTTTPAPQYATQRPDKPFNLALHIGNSNEDAIYCEGNCTFSIISDEIEQAFGGVTGYLYIREAIPATRRKRAVQFTVDILFEAASMQALNETVRATELNAALGTLNTSSTVLVVTDRANETIVIPFAKDASDQCTIQDACPLGYRCKNSVCYHQCDGFDCGSNGVCNTVVNTGGNSESLCVCNSNYDYTYSGDRCQDRQMSKKKVAAILGGVLGTFCAFLLIIIILLYCRLKGNGDSGRGKYQLGGYSNGAYADNEIGMKDVAENP